MSLAYKVLTAAEFAALLDGRFEGEAVDVADGYVHLSTAGQLTETVLRHFGGQEELVIAAVELDRLGNSVRWEVSRRGEKFPHLYGRLTMAAVVAHAPLAWDASGEVAIP